MSIEEQHVALPKLYGAPAYARPPTVAATILRPFDPDDLPIEAAQSEEDRAFVATLPSRAWEPGGALLGSSSGGDQDGDVGMLTGRPLRLREIAGRLLHQD